MVAINYNRKKILDVKATFYSNRGITRKKQFDDIHVWKDR